MKVKKVSQLDSDGYFIGPTEAYESPLEPDVFHIPGGAVDVEPPEIPEGKRAKWADDWVLEDVPPPETDEQAEAEATAPIAQLTPLQFLDLFTESEQLAIVQAAMQSASVKLWYDRVLASQSITLTDPRIEAGVTALVTAELLTAERKAEILGIAEAEAIPA